MQLEIAAAT